MGHRLPFSKASAPEHIVWENILSASLKFHYYFILTFLIIISAIVSYGIISLLKLFEFVDSQYGS